MWKSIAPDYEVSTGGQVRSFKGKSPRILKPQLGKNGYLFVVLMIGGKPKNYFIHRLVAQAHNAKRTNADVLYIRDNPDHLTRAQLAEKLGVGETTISEIQLSKKYKAAGGAIRDKRGVHGCGYQALAKKFGVCQSTVLNIIRASQLSSSPTNGS